MDLKKLNPWNWFKHEQDASTQNSVAVQQAPQSGALRTREAHPLVQLQREMDRIFDEVFNWLPQWSGLEAPSQPLIRRPKTDIAASGDQYSITLEVPGLSAEDLTVEVNGDTLLVRGETAKEEKREDKHYYCVERRHGSFQRLLSLPEDAARSDIRANLKDGVLELTIPRLAQKREDVKQIPIQS